MQQPGLRAAPLDRHLERLQRQPSIIDGADRPADHEPGIQIENRRQIQLGVLANDELGRVADPALIRTRRNEVAIEYVGRDRVVVIAVRRVLEAFSGPCPGSAPPTSDA
jgi:hypothetical protein